METKTITAESSGGLGALEKLGLNESILREAVFQGCFEASNCTDDDVPGMAGTLRVGKTLRALREILRKAGWGKQQVGVPTVKRPDGRVAITVVTGDEGTGREDRHPRTKHDRGPATADVLVENDKALRQGVLPFMLEPVSKKAEAVAPACQTWIVLLHPDPDEVSVWAELSLPRGELSESRRVDQWAERILLGRLTWDNDPLVAPKDGVPEFEIEVRRKSR